MSASWDFRSLVVALVALYGALDTIGDCLLIHNRSSSRSGNEAYYNEESGSNAHKCRMEIPNTALGLYKYARILRQGSLPGFSIIEACCEGYDAIKLGNQAYCFANCDGKCINGHCRTPGDCVCYNDFVKNDDDECVFSCPLGCLNGQCSIDGWCKCNRGYTLDATKKFCRPICDGGCGRDQNCTAPGTCSCSKGYTLRAVGCIPVCDPSCGKGGSCYSPNKCTCAEGYTLKNGVCQAKCYQKCENGICLESNRCICYPGFRYHEKATTCIPNL